MQATNYSNPITYIYKEKLYDKVNMGTLKINGEDIDAVIYCPKEGGGIYVRTADDFYAKFKWVENV